METINALAICGSLRKNSYNKMILKIACEIAEDLGAKVQELNLKELNLPVYDEDLENSLDMESVKILKNAIESSELLIIASPEYNHSVSGALKNAIDWATRKGNSFSGKHALIFGASTGIYGTVRAQANLRQVLTAVGVIVQPQPQVFIGNVDKALDENGKLKDQKIYEQLKLLVKRTIDFIK